MSDTQQYDTARTKTLVVNVGADPRSTMQRIFLALREFVQLVDQDGMVMITINAYVPPRRLPPG